MSPTPEPNPGTAPDPSPGPSAVAPEVRMLADLDLSLAQAGPEQSGALWKLEETARQLDANLVRLPAGATVAAHAEPELDVLLLVVSGSGSLDAPAGTLALAPHTLIWLPHGSRRALNAGPDGLAYLTVHRARPGMRIRLPQDPELLRRLEEREEATAEQGGEAACQLARLCPSCGAMTDPPAPCPSCGKESAA